MVIEHFFDIQSMSTFSVANRERDMALITKVSVVSMLHLMSILAYYCAAEDNKTAKQPSPVVVCDASRI